MRDDHSGNSRLNIQAQQVYYVLMCLIGGVAILHFAKTLLVPFAFALLLAFIFYPLCCFFERRGVNRLWSILWTLFGINLLLALVLFLFSSQLIDLTNEFQDFSNRIYELLESLAAFANKHVSFMPTVNESEIVDMTENLAAKKAGNIVRVVISNTAVIFSHLVLTIIYTFLLLLYRAPLKRTLVSIADESKRTAYGHMINAMQKVGQRYVVGMLTLIVILGLLNSLGLLILGIDYAFFFGFLAAFLAIVPYIGTVLGGALPALYALMVYDSLWYPAGVILIFWGVQLIESNFLSPYVVGGNLNLNALAAIVALIAGGLLWGIPGMVLFLPFTAVFKVACEHYEGLQPVSHLLSDGMHNDSKESNSVLYKLKRWVSTKRGAGDKS